MTRRATLAIVLLLAPMQTAAEIDIGTSKWLYSSDLAERGFEPFAASAANAIYGMRNGQRIYLCFVLDTPAAQAARQAALLGEIAGTATGRTIPNIPVACVLTQ